MKKYIAIAILLSFHNQAIASDIDSQSTEASNNNVAEESSVETHPEESTTSIESDPNLSNEPIINDTTNSTYLGAAASETIAVPTKSMEAIDGTIPLRVRDTSSPLISPNSLKHSKPWHWPDFEMTILAGGAGAYIPVNEHLTETSLAPGAPARYRFDVSGEGFSGGASLGANYRRGNYTFGGSITGYLDAHSLKNFDAKRDSYGGDINHSMTFLKRSYTLEFAGKIGRYFDEYHLYGKLGVMCSAFQYKYRRPEVDYTKNVTAWGGILGIGVEREYNLPAIGESKIGLQYNYQLYETLTPIVKYVDHTSKSKLRPRYHTGYLTISKTF